MLYFEPEHFMEADALVLAITLSKQQPRSWSIDLAYGSRVIAKLDLPPLGDDAGADDVASVVARLDTWLRGIEPAMIDELGRIWPSEAGPASPAPASPTT